MIKSIMLLLTNMYVSLKEISLITPFTRHSKHPTYRCQPWLKRYQRWRGDNPISEIRKQEILLKSLSFDRKTYFSYHFSYFFFSKVRQKFCGKDFLVGIARWSHRCMINKIEELMVFERDDEKARLIKKGKERSGEKYMERRMSG